MKNFEVIYPLLSHSEFCAAIGESARARREVQKLSRRELAEKSGVSVATITRFETKGVATISVMVKIARALGAIKSLEPLFAPPKFGSLDEFIKHSER